jgi:hypothetical protein
MRGLWRRFGRLHAVGVLCVWFALVATVALGASPPDALLAAATALLVLYCIARRRGGWNVFWIAIAPHAISSLLHDIAGTPRWIAALLIPVALLVAWSDEREAVAQRE